MNKNSFRNNLQKILEELDSESAYITNPDVFASEYDSLINSFNEYQCKVNIAYSFKTNYIPEFLDIVNRKNGYAEVVSIMELELAIKVGFDPRKIFFNGPFKHKRETFKYLKLGVLVNVDSYDELLMINSFAIDTKTKCRIGIRLNFNNQDYPSRFGISIHDRKLKEILKICYNSDLLVLESLHYHYSSRSLSTWEICMEDFINFLSDTDSTLLNNINYVSLGGGMYSRMDNYIQEQLSCAIPTFEDYAYVSIRKLSEFISKSNFFYGNTPEVLIEPGTALASKAVDFVAKIFSIKNVGEAYFINTSASIYNMNPSPNRINSPIEIINQNKNDIKFIEGKLCGYTCIESDIIHDDFKGEIAKEDFIIFKEVGSYSVVMKPPFIHPDVPILSRQGNFLKVIRDKQSFVDVFRNFRF